MNTKVALVVLSLTLLIVAAPTASAHVTMPPDLLFLLAQTCSGLPTVQTAACVAGAYLGYSADEINHQCAHFFGEDDCDATGL